MNRRILGVLTLGVVVLIVVLSATLLPQPNERPGTERLASADRRQGADQSSRRRSSRLQTTAGLFDLSKTRKPVFLEVFATWCPHCQHEAPIVDRLYREVSEAASTSSASRAAIRRWTARPLPRRTTSSTGFVALTCAIRSRTIRSSTWRISICKAAFRPSRSSTAKKIRYLERRRDIVRRAGRGAASRASLDPPRGKRVVRRRNDRRSDLEHDLLV